jgi:hypothetical protein
MSVDGIVVENERFEAVQVTEETLEGVIRAAGASLFPGLAYYRFRPPIPSRWGVRHPDGALLARGCPQWWVVEIELHTHDVDKHVIPQLEGLGDGTYGWQAFEYLEREEGLKAADFSELDVWEPSFLLIVDHLTPQLRGAAARSAFDPLECGVFRSMHNRYALGVNGARPVRAADALPGGLDVRLEETFGVAVLVPLDRRLPADLPEAVLVGNQYARVRRTTDREAFVLPLTPADVEDAAGRAERYRLTSDGRLVPAARPQR